MTVIAASNHKGGTGKTTSVIHLAAALGMSGHRTLVVDFDPQCFLTRMLGVEEPPEEHSSAVLFNHDVALCDVPVCTMKTFDLLPSSSVLTKLMRRLNKPTDVFWAREALQSGTEYDVVLFDTAAAVTVFSINALVASDLALVPVTPEYQPVLGAEQTFQSVELVRKRLNPDLHGPVFLFTQVDARKNSHRLYRRYMRSKYGPQIMRSVIRTSAALAEAHTDGSTAFENDPYSRGARDYANATDELLGILFPDRVPPTSSESGQEPPPRSDHTLDEDVSAGGGALSDEEVDYLRRVHEGANVHLRGESVHAFWQPIRDIGP
jgi:chromosome partitioning protein